MKSIRGLVLVLSIITGVFGCSGSCPREGRLTSCRCAGGKVTCSDVNDSDTLQTEMEALRNDRKPYEQRFDYFELNSNTIESLGADAFSGVLFRELRFNYNEKLVCVNPMAFNYMQAFTQRIIAKSTSFSNITENCNIFAAISSLSELQIVNITAHHIKEIPKNAFRRSSGSPNKLYWLSLNGVQEGSLTTINENAFSDLRGLKYVDLSNNKISVIKKEAFLFFEDSGNNLEINLENNYDAADKKGLSGKSFEVSVFKTGRRPTKLKLGKNPLLKFLKEEVFMTFLLDNPDGRNTIDLEGTPLGYYRENSWLVELKNRLHLQNKITNARMEGGKSLWDVSVTSLTANGTYYFDDLDY